MKPTLPANQNSAWLKEWLAYGALFALVLWVFLPAVDNEFIGYDDPDYVTANPMVQRGLTGASVVWAFTATAAANWHPLTWLSHMADVQFFGQDPAGHHLTSVLLHALNAVLVFLVFRQLTGATGRSWLVAAFFGLHPLRAESVAWVSERKDVLSMTFWLLTMLAYVWSQRGPDAGTRAKRRLVTLLCFALGLMCKPMLVTLPCVLLLLDYWPLQRLQKGEWRACVREKLPFFVLAAVACVITFVVQRGAGAVNEVTPLNLRLGNALVAGARYLGKLLWPVDLAFFYPLPEGGWPVAAVAGAGGLLLAVSAGAWFTRKNHPYLLMGWLWFLGTLVPVIGIVAVGQQAMADRYTYIPTLGLLVAVVWGLTALLQEQTVFVTGARLASAGLLLVCAVLAREQTRTWRNTETLCRHALAVTRDNFLAHDMLGVALGKQGQAVEALAEHEAAVRLKPACVECQDNLGVALQRFDRFADAITHHEAAVKLRPQFAPGYFNLAQSLERSGKVRDAQRLYLRAIELRPAYADAHFNLGNLYLRANLWPTARESFLRVLALEPGSPDVLNNLGIVAMNLGQLDEALGYYEQAINAKPEEARFYFNAAVCLEAKGNRGGALRGYEEALKLQPDYPEARLKREALLSGATNAAPGPPGK